MNPEPATPDRETIAALARRHGLHISGEIEVNDIGLDFRVAFAADEAGRAWVLRIPRRPDVLPGAANEARVLRLLGGRTPVAVPDWQIFTPELIAYPRLPGTTAMTVDQATRQPSWNIDKDSPAFASSFAQALEALHSIPPEEAREAGLKASSPDEVRRAAAEIDTVRREVGVGEELRNRWQAWLDDDALWPPFTSLVHGDLYAAHVLVDEAERDTCVLDWTEAEVGDPSVDFTFHLMGFGDEGLERPLTEYESEGGRTWPGMRRHVGERVSVVPVKYALFALASGLDEHLRAARAQLGAG